jgi:putative restriction endonuclease
VRSRAFEWLAEQVELHGDVLPWRLLHQGFQIGEQRVPLLSQQGIFKPRLCDVPLSIRSAPDGPYDDAMLESDLLRYRYQGTDPHHWQNAGLREAMRRGTPMVYFYGVDPAAYLAVWPVYVVDDEPVALTFTIALSSPYALFQEPRPMEVAEPRREYVTATFRRRLHQATFRQRVLRAYRERCAICQLRHRELLDAAHIVPDRAPEGEPRISNGLSLCKLHHAAFDRYFVTVDPDYRVVIRQDVLEESDGPMLRHGLQELHGSKILLPRRSEWEPSRDALAARLERFRRAG